MSIEMLKSYYKEREGKETIVNEMGFCTYIISGQECYIETIFVLEEFRRMGVAKRLADDVSEIAKKQGCEILTGTVFPKANGSHESMLALIGYGMRLHSSDTEKIVFIKEL